MFYHCVNYKEMGKTGIYYSAGLSKTLVSHSTQSLSESVNAPSDTTCASHNFAQGLWSWLSNSYSFIFPRLPKYHTWGYFRHFAFTSYSSRCCMIWVGEVRAETWQMPHCTEQRDSQNKLCNLLLSTLRTDVLKVHSVIFCSLKKL